MEQLTSVPKRISATLNVYLIPKRQAKTLLSIRKNTGYYDGYYSLVAGHVEHNESATTAMIREAEEEAGIILSPQNLKVVHMMHRKTNRNNIDIFFECYDWQGNIENKEPEKCAGLEFHALDALPSNTIPYIRQVLLSFEDSVYSEDGWPSFKSV